MKLIYLLIIIFCVKFSTAQEITFQQTLDYINSKLALCCSINVSKGNIIAIYKEGGQLIREDEARINELDISSIKYNDTYKIFSINCKGAPAKKCVARDLPTKGDKTKAWYQPYARISWELNLDSKSAAGLKNAFTHMIRLVLEPKYKSSEPFE